MRRFVYSPDYRCELGEHVFRTERYELLYREMIRSQLARPDEFLRPEPPGREDLELVHTPAYVDELLSGRHTERTARSEMPISPEIVRAFVLNAGGSMLACRRAVTEHTLTMNLGGGLHHAFPDHAEGFCYVNDVALGIRTLRRDGLVGRAMVVDCDLHQGNGTAYIFRNEPDVFTFSIHQENLYPVKETSDLDVGLPDYCPGQSYLELLAENLLPALDLHGPQFVLYVAGADPYCKDMLGSLMLSIEELKRRDELVLSACVERDVPAATVLAGGYGPTVADTVRVHYGTAETVVRLGRELDG